MSNRLTQTLKIGNRTFQCNFWTDYLGKIPLDYVQVIELVERKTIFGIPCIREEKISECWGAEDRVEWCHKAIDRLFAEEEARKKDLEKVFNFCNKPLDN